jgi:DNA-binding LytR/AlgR family response regulator
MDLKTKTQPNHSLTLKGHLGRGHIPKSDIICCKAYSVGTLVCLRDETHHLLKENIDELRTMLDSENFFIIDKYTLINVDYIESIFPRAVGLKNGEEYPIGQRKKKALFNRIKKVYDM